MTQDLGCGPEVDGCALQADEEDVRARRAGRSGAADRALALIGREVVGEADRKVQKERRLERRCGHVAPVNDPVEGVEFAGVTEGVQDERNQAEDVKMDRLGSRPAPEEDVDSDTEIDKRDEPEALIDGTVFGLEDDLDIETWLRLEVGGVRNGPKDGVGCMGPDAAAEHFADQRGETGVGWSSMLTRMSPFRMPARWPGEFSGDPFCSEAACELQPTRCRRSGHRSHSRDRSSGPRVRRRNRRQGESYGQNARLGGVLHEPYQQLISTSNDQTIT